MPRAPRHDDSVCRQLLGGPLRQPQRGTRDELVRATAGLVPPPQLLGRSEQADGDQRGRKPQASRLPCEHEAIPQRARAESEGHRHQRGSMYEHVPRHIDPEHDQQHQVHCDVGEHRGQRTIPGCVAAQATRSAHGDGERADEAHQDLNPQAGRTTAGGLGGRRRVVVAYVTLAQH